MADFSLPGDFGLPATSPLYANGMAIDDAIAAQKKTASPKLADSQRFWASRALPLNHKSHDGIIVNLAKPKKINYLSLDLPQFPQHFYFWWWNDKTGDWEEFKGPSSGVIRVYMDGSSPAVVGTAAAYQSRQHPSHYGAGHWVHYDIDVHPVTTRRIRMQGTRSFGSRKGGPKDPQGRPANYSLGVRNLDFGWRVRTKEDVPRTPRDPDILTEYTSFTQTLDLLGNPVELVMRENRAADLLRGQVWKSEPQPVPYAVVNFYVDARNGAGDPQVIDRFDIAPLQGGASLNLYYADQMPDSDFGASDAPIVFPMLRPAGESPPEVQPSGILFPDQIGYLDLLNQAVQWNPAKPFWIAMEFRPQWASTDTTPHIVFDAGDLQLAWNAGVFRLAYGGGALYQQPFDFDANARLRAVVSYDGERLSFYMPETGMVANVPSTMDGMACEKIRLGAELGDSDAPTAFTGHYRLNAMVIKQEPLILHAPDGGGLAVPEPVQRFIEDPATYLDKPEYRMDEDGSTDNALLRYLPSLAVDTSPTSVNPHGFVGGPGTIFEDVVWTPITRDYKLRAGMLQFHPVRAKFFKFEFTNLIPEPYQTYAPVTRTVKTFSQAARQAAANPQKSTQIKQSATSTGLTANADATMQTVRYADTPAITAPSEADVLPTEALHASDLRTQEQLDREGGLYRFDSWQPGSTAPRYAETSRHHYEEVKVAHAKRIAYFVGLSGLRMYRVNYSAPDDAEQYVELFDDTAHIDPDYLTERVVIGTTNLVPNPSFENGIAGHTLYSAGTATDAALTAVAGGRFGDSELKVSASALGPASTDRVGWRATFTTPDLTAPVAYSVYARRVAGLATVRLNVEYYDGASFLVSDSRTFTPEPQVGDVLNANPGFEDGVTGWTGLGGTLVHTSAQFHDGTGSAQMTPDGATAIVRIDSALVPIDPAASYHAQGWLRCATARSVSLNVNWYDAEGGYIDTSWYATDVTAGVWTKVSLEAQPPAGAAQANIIPTLAGTPASTDVLWADGVELRPVIDSWQRCAAVLLPPPDTDTAVVSWWLEAGDGGPTDYRFDGYQVEDLRLTDYCDGDQEGCAWTGTPHQSASTRAGIDIRPWGWDGDRLYTGSGTANPVTTMSRTFPSKRRVRGVQFATQQSSAVQLAADPDFAAADLCAAWIPTGDVVAMERNADIGSTLGSAVRVLRSSALNTWDELRATYPSWSALEGSSYDSLEGDSAVVGGGGIEQRTAVQVSEAGRVWAAARVYADHALSAPLTLQILSASGDVLAEKDQPVTAGKIVEWSVGYTIGEVPTTHQTWMDIMRRDPSPVLPTYADLEAGRWNDLSDAEAVDARALKVRIIQRSAGQDSWYVDSLALFEDPIVWEFSNDDGATWWPALGIRNDPRGVLIFPNSLAPAPGDPTGLRWRVTGHRPGLHVSALDIRPWYAETVFGIPRREPGVSGGPNVQPTDHYPVIEDDPYFKQWSDPIPQDWYHLFRQLLLLDRQQVPVTPVSKPDTFANPYSLLVDVETVTPPEPYLDLYTGSYAGIYGVVNDAGGVYEDTYDPENEY